ncbi:MAG: hypothetical protein ACKV2V_13645 [Blastocatellia bacterium]
MKNSDWLMLDPRDRGQAALMAAQILDEAGKRGRSEVSRQAEALLAEIQKGQYTPDLLHILRAELAAIVQRPSQE